MNSRKFRHPSSPTLLRARADCFQNHQPNFMERRQNDFMQSKVGDGEHEILTAATGEAHRFQVKYSIRIFVATGD